MASSRDLTFALKFQTTNTAAINKAAKEINKTAQAAKKIEKEAKQAASAMTRLGLAARNAGKRMVRFSREARAAFSRMRTGAIRLGAALAAIGFAVGFTVALNVAKEFEFQMARLAAISGQLGRETGEQFRALEGIARRLGGTTQFTAGQVANGLRLLAQAGFSAQEAIAAIPGTLNLAVAATTDLGTATTIVANTIRGFNLEASEAGKIADILTATTQKSNTTIEALGEALKFVAPAAASANQNIEAMSAAIGTLSNAGLKGTLAGTGLRRVIVGLLNPTKAARNAFARLGLDVKDLDPRLRDLSDIMTDLNKAGFGASEAFEAFGLRGGPAALVLSNLLGTFKELNDEITESEGIAQAFADRINDTLRGSILRLKSAFEEFIISNGALAESFRDLVDGTRLVLEALNGTINPLEDGAQSAIQFAGVLRNLKPLLATIGVAFLALAGFIAFLAGGWALLAAAGAAFIVTGGVLVATIALTDAEMQQFNKTAEANVDVIDRIAAAELALAEAKKAADAPGAGKDERDALAFATGDNLALGDAALARAKATELEIESINRALAEDVLKRNAIINKSNEEVSFFGLFSLQRGTSGPDQQALRDLDARKAKLEEIRLEREKGLVVLQAEAKERTDALKAADERNRAQKEFRAQQIRDANEINQVLNSETGKRTTQLDSLADEILVLEATLAGGAGGKIAAEIEKIRQAAGFSGAAADEAGIQSGALLERINRQIASAQANLDTISISGTEEQIRLAKELVEAQKDNLEQIRKLTKANVETEAAFLTRTNQIRNLKLAIEAQTKARQEAAAAIKKQEAAERSFERFRITQLAKLQEEIILQGTAVDEREKAAAAIKLVTRASAAGVEVNQEWIDSLFMTIEALDEAKGAADGFFEGFAKGAQDFINDSATFAEQGADLFKNTFKSLEDELVGFVETGKFSFRSLGETIRSTLLRQGIRNVIQGTLSAIPGLSGSGEGGTAQEAAVAQLRLIQKTMLLTPRASQTTRTNALLLNIDASIRNLGGFGGTSGVGVNLDARGGPAAFGNFGGNFFTDPVGNATQAVFDGAGGVGGITSAIDNIARTGGKIPSFKMGGDTRKALGLDRDSIPAILHPNEAVIPLTRDGRVPLDIVNGLPEVRLPGTGRSIGTATDAPAKAAQVNAITQAATSANENVRGGSKSVNPLAFFGAPGFVDGGATGGGFSFGGLLSGIGSAIGGAFSATLKFFQDFDFGETFSGFIGGAKELFSGENNILGGLFGGGGFLSGVNDFFTGGAADLAGGAGVSETAAGLNTVTEQLSPGAQIGKGFDQVKTQLKDFGGRVGNFVGIGGQAASSNSDVPVSLQDPTQSLQPASLKSVSSSAIPAELSGLGNVTEGARRALEDIPAIGRLFKKNEETGRTPFGQVASAAVPIGLSLLLSQFAEQGGKRGKSSFSSTGRVVGFTDKNGESVELSKEEKELLEQLNSGRKALGNAGGGSSLRSGNIPAFASGGIVNGPTLALVGERTPEAIIPLAGGAVPVRVSGGQQTGKVITNNVNFSIITPNADSFREAQSQIQASTAASIGRAAARQD